MSVETPPPEQPKPEPEPTPVQEEEAPPKVIEIKPPPPLEGAMDPIIDMYMEMRGLKDKKQAAVKLANVLYNLGFNPQRDIDNVTTYINNMSAILSSIPDTPETAPVKGAILARTAAEASMGLRKAHMLSTTAEEEELEREARFYRRMAMSMRMMDKIFSGGGESTSNPEVAALKEQVKILQEQLKKEEEAKAIESKLAPIREQLSSIAHRLDMLATQPPRRSEEGESSLSKEVRQMLDAMSKRLDALDQRYQTSQEIQSIRNEIATLKTSLEKGGKPSDVTEVFDQATKLIDKVNEVVKKAGGFEGEFDWRAAAISSASEIATEAISAYRDIATSKPQQEETKTQAKGKVSDEIVERKLLSYLQQRLAQGATDFNSLEAARTLGVSESDILNAFARLKRKGILKSVGESGESGGKPEPEPEPEWVEG